MESAWAAHEAAWADRHVPDERKMLDGAVALFGTPALARLDDLVAMASQWRPDIVVHEVLEQAGSMLAGRLGVRAVVHGIGPMFPTYALLIDAAAKAIGEPDLWERLSTEQAVDLCPPALQPDGPPPWRESVAVRPVPAKAAGCHRTSLTSSRAIAPSSTSPSAPSRTPRPPTSPPDWRPSRTTTAW